MAKRKVAAPTLPSSGSSTSATSSCRTASANTTSQMLSADVGMQEHIASTGYVVTEGRMTRSQKAQQTAAAAAAAATTAVQSASSSSSASTKRQVTRHKRRFVPYVDLKKRPEHLKPHKTSPSLTLALSLNTEMRYNKLWEKKVTEEHRRGQTHPFEVPNWNTEKFLADIQGLCKYYFEKASEKDEAAAAARAAEAVAEAAEDAEGSDVPMHEDDGEEHDASMDEDDIDPTNIFAAGGGPKTAFVKACRSGTLAKTPAKTLRETVASLEPAALLESDVTPSDYMEGVLPAKRRRAHKQRREVSDTEQDNLEDDIELADEAEVSPERGGSKSSKVVPTEPQSSMKAGSKTFNVPVGMSADGLDLVPAEEDENVGAYVRRLNPYNIHGLVYARLHPKKDWESKPEFSQRRSADYAMRKGTTDQDLQKLMAELLMDHYDIISDPTNLKTAAGRVRLAQKQLLTMSENISRNSPDVVTMSVCLYVGPDQAACQASSVVSGSPEGIDFLTKNELPIQLLIDSIVDHIRSKANPAALASVLQSILVNPNTTVPPTRAAAAPMATSAVQAGHGAAEVQDSKGKEVLGRRLIKKMKGKIEGKKEKDQPYVVDALAQKIRVSTGLSLVNINWKYFTDVYCFDHQLTLIEWPSSVLSWPIYGIPKITNDFKTHHWQALANAIRAGRLRFIEWTDEQKAMDPSSQEYLAIPLFVTDADVIKETVGSLLRAKQRHHGSHITVPPSAPPPLRAPISMTPVPDSEDEAPLEKPSQSIPHAAVDAVGDDDFLGYSVKRVPRPLGVRFDPMDTEDVEVSLIRKVPATARRGEMGPMAYNPKLRGPGVPGPQDFYSAASVLVPPSHRIPPPNHPSHRVVISAPPEQDENRNPHACSSSTVRKSQIGQPFVTAAEARNYRYRTNPIEDVGADGL